MDAHELAEDRALLIKNKQQKDELRRQLATAQRVVEEHATCGNQLAALQRQISVLEMKLLQLQNAAGAFDLELTQGADATTAGGDVHDDGSAVHGRSQASTPSATSQSLLHSPGAAVPKLCGVGLMIAKADAGEEYLDAHGGRLWVSRLVPNGAAALSKSIRQHDELLAVDGQRVHELQDAFDLLRGPRESKVCLCLCVCARKSIFLWRRPADSAGRVRVMCC